MKNALLLALVISAVWEGAAGAELSATLYWAHRAELGVPVSGVISEIRVGPGQAVAEGELLLRLDPRAFQARLKAAESVLERARLERDEAQRELDRTTELYDRTLLSDHERHLAAIALASANAGFEGARAAVVEARLDLRYSRIEAPFDGVVVAVRAERGEAIVSRLATRTLVVVADHRRMRAVAAVPAEQLEGLAPDRPLRVAVANQWLDARVLHLGLEPLAGQPERPLYALDVMFAVPEGSRWRAGQKAVVRLDE